MSIHLLNRFRKAALAAMLLSAGAANASMLDFKVTGDYSAEWQLDSNVAPAFVDKGVDFYLHNVAGSYANTNSVLADFFFYNNALKGGFALEDSLTGKALLVTDSVQLYTGPESSPTFLTGTFSMTQYMGTGKYTLVVTDATPTSDVPEPASGAMLLGGLGLLGLLRKRRQGR